MSILLVILQPVMFSDWCALCLYSVLVGVPSSAIGVTMRFTTAIRGKITEQFGEGWSTLWHRD